MSQSDVAADMPSLLYVPRASLTIRRRQWGRGFVYFDSHGNKIDDPATLRRIRMLAIPPAYRKVRIARQPNAHLQAVIRPGTSYANAKKKIGWKRSVRRCPQSGGASRAGLRYGETLVRNLASTAGQ
jgi:hypothetical protein